MPVRKGCWPTRTRNRGLLCAVTTWTFAEAPRFLLRSFSWLALSAFGALCPAAFPDPSPPFPGQGGWLRPSSVLPPSMCGLLFSGGLSPIVRTTPRSPCDSEGVTEVCSPAGETRVQQGSPRGSLPVPGLCSGPHTGLSLTGPSESYSAQHGLVTGSAIGGPPGGSLSPRTSTQLRQDVGSHWPASPPHSACPAGSPPPGGGA